MAASIPEAFLGEWPSLLKDKGWSTSARL
ncbi:hypothetical protein ARSEF1564_001494 [Beauveria bassiana]